MLWWDEIWGFSFPLGSKDGQSESGHLPLIRAGNPTHFPQRRGIMFLPCQVKFCSHKCEGEKLMFYLVQQEPGKERWNSSLRMIQNAFCMAAVGFWGRAVFPLIPHFTTCFWYKAAQVYSLAVYTERSPVLKRNWRKEQEERHTSTPEQLRQKCKLIKMMMMLIIIQYVK